MPDLDRAAAHLMTLGAMTDTEMDALACVTDLARIASGTAAAPNPMEILRPTSRDGAASDDGRMADAMYRILLEQLPVVTFLAKLGAEHNEIYVSPHIEQMLGFTREQWLDNPVLWYDRLHEEDKARWNVEFSQFLVQDEPFRSVYRFIAKDGRVVWVRGEVTKIRDENGQPIYIQGIGYDITELKMAEEIVKRAHDELEQRVVERTAELATANDSLREEVAERKRSQEELHKTEMQLLHSAKLASLGTLATGVAHELNQPLAVIRGISQQLKHEEGMSEDCVEDLTLIEGQTLRMIKIINHLRTFARAPSVEMETININDVALNCFVLIGEQLKSHGIAVVKELSETPLQVRADANELEQVFLNLVTNSRDAIDGLEDATLSVRSWTEDGKVVVEVRDNGPGVPKELESRIMDPFFTTKDAGKGTGLGLSISHSIVTRFNGTLEYRTDGGACFTVKLPAYVAPEMAKAA